MIWHLWKGARAAFDSGMTYGLALVGAYLATWLPLTQVLAGMSIVCIVLQVLTLHMNLPDIMDELETTELPDLVEVAGLNLATYLFMVANVLWGAGVAHAFNDW